MSSQLIELPGTLRSVYCQIQVSVTIETTLMKQTYSLLVALLLLASAPAMAQWAEIPTSDLDNRTLRTQAKVESLYQRGDYKRAHFIYSNELARRGDKYAQYMTGYMYQMGQGVDEDPVKASAWYRLAAERRAPEFIAVRDQLLQTLNDAQRARSDELYVALRKEYSDLVIIMGLLAGDVAEMKVARTGSRLSGGTSPVKVVDPKTGRTVSADYLRSRNLRIAQMRLDYITTHLDMEPLEADEVSSRMDGLWEIVHEHLDGVDDEPNGLNAAH